MFEYLKMDMWKNGTEHCTAYGSFAIDDREIWYGTKYCLINDHVKNNWVIEKMNTNTYIGVIAKGKEETLSLGEFKKWLQENGINDAYMEWLRKNPDYVKQYPKICGAAFV